MMISLTTPLTPQEVYALSRWDEQGQAELMSETAAATFVQCCAHRHPAADCDKLGGSGQCPTWWMKGGRYTDSAICSVQQQLSKHAWLVPSGKPATSKHPWEERRGRMDRGVLFHPLGSAKQGPFSPWLGHWHRSPSVCSNPVLGKWQSKGELPTTWGRKGFAALETLPVSESTPEL